MTKYEQMIFAFVQEWRKEAARRREDAALEVSLGARENDAELGYAEALEDKAAEIEKLAHGLPFMLSATR